MSFIRIKKISGKEYAYLVENRWYKRGFKGKGKGSRQKVSRYLGRVHSFVKVDNTGFFEFKGIKEPEQYLKSNNKEKVFGDLVEWELFRHCVDKKEFMINLDKTGVSKNGKEVTLKINDGFLNSYTLNRLFNLKSGDSYYLARCFVDAGIDVPKEVFVGVFGK
ncbi:hypothetical protein KY347_01800 [Candidatus Woesearchaeota archaeon]|nr:hypothetical protein [Candidatus Woesearchaeota archaeon]